ncbi:hypothetical protein P3H15_27140 [Rhodococcus sp. T2V]|uniref:hypothetical protein n=1 Tax=Rhodococcus sp. T2V TaxID=3034164 RepID=UPI0023E243FE|nr:hypothetical protein [Rhodococcus sp. T2V]MDF3308697.1 hypothetical protein [Rhodococcus sp. T2V]
MMKLEILPNGDGSTDAETKFSEEAVAEYALAVTRYQETLKSIAVTKCTVEMVLVEHVRAAVSALKETPAENNGLKTFLDWVKRLAFLFIGFSVVQGSNVLRQQDVDRGSVMWLVMDAVFAALLVGLALAVDIPPIRRLIIRDAKRS